MAGLDEHFLRELFDCPRAATAASLAVMMMEELVDALIARERPSTGSRAELASQALMPKLDLLEDCAVLSPRVLTAMRHLAELHQRNTDEVTLADYQAVELPDLEQLLQGHHDTTRVPPAIRLNVALCHLLMRIKDQADAVSSQED